MKVFIVCLALACLSVSRATKFEDCGSTVGTVKSLSVSDCPDTDNTCILKHNTNKTITIEFDSKTAATKVTAVVHGVIGGMPLPFPVPNPDGCKFGGLTCPLENGKSYTYTHNLFIRPSYPPLGVKVRWELQDEANKDIVCIEIPCHIQ